MAWINIVRACWTYDLSRYVPILINKRPIGYARQDAADVASHFGRRKQEGVILEAASPSDVSALLDEISRRLRSQGLIPPLTHELYPVRHGSDEPDLGCLDRSASLALGIRTYGVHLNAYVRKSGKLWMWIARRAANRRYFPRMLDNIVAGGQPANIGIRENLEKESEEEAAIPKDLIKKAEEHKKFAYRFDGPDGLVDSVVYPFDLEVPLSFEPQNVDGGIEGFFLMSMEEVAENVLNLEFKFNCALVIIDFLLRREALSARALGRLKQVRAMLYQPEPAAYDPLY